MVTRTWLYLDSLDGDDAFDGKYPVPMGGTMGPKKTARGITLIQSQGNGLQVKRHRHYDTANGFFPVISAKEDYVVTTYGTGENPIFDGFTYVPKEDGGWGPEGDGVWSKVYGSSTSGNGGVKRLFVGSINNGVLIGQRDPGVARLRAKGRVNNTTINYNSLAVVKENLNATDIWYWAGSALGYKLFVYTGSNTISPPEFYNGLALVGTDGTTGATYGSGPAFQVQRSRNVSILGIDQWASASYSFIITNQSGFQATRNVLMLGCNSKYSYQGHSKIAPEIGNTVAAISGIENVLVDNCLGDAGTNPKEQEPNENYSHMSGAMDMFSVYDGAKDVKFRNCKSVNSTHVAFTLGKYSLNKPECRTDNCGFENCEMFADTWHTYARGFTAYDCLPNCYIRGCYFDGQSVRSQIAGSPLVVSNTWVNFKQSVRKSDVSGWLYAGAEILNRSNLSNWGTERYVVVTPIRAKVLHNLANGPVGVPVQIETFAAYNIAGVPEPAISDDAITLGNNILNDNKTSLLETVRIIDRSSVVGRQRADRNIIDRGDRGAAKIRRINSSNQSVFSDLNVFPGFSNNLLTDPMIDLTDPRSPKLAKNSPCRRAGKWFAHAKDVKGRPFMLPPTIGPLEFAGRDTRAPRGIW